MGCGDTARARSLLLLGLAEDDPALAQLLQDQQAHFSLSAQPLVAAAAAAAAALNPGVPHAAIVGGPVEEQLAAIARLRAACRSLFIVCWHPQATEDAALRWAAFEAGANMATCCPHALSDALSQVASTASQAPSGSGSPSSSSGSSSSGSSTCTCDWCGLPGLSASEYWSHQGLYHVHAPNMAGTCQLCGRHTSNLARHLHDTHHPLGLPPEERTGVFALVVVRRPSDGRFLMTQEFAGAGFWLPGGGVDPGECLADAARRECWEEAGQAIQLTGILELEQHRSSAWRRVIFAAEPAQPAAAPDRSDSHDAGAAAGAGGPLLQPRRALHACCCPKSLPDFESAGAAWVSAGELASLPLRSASEPHRWLPLLDTAGGAAGLEAEVAPLATSLTLPPEWAEVFAGFPVTRQPTAGGSDAAGLEPRSQRGGRQPRDQGGQDMQGYELTLCDDPHSEYCAKVKVALHAKGLAWDTRLAAPCGGSAAAAGPGQLPLGKIPVLRVRPPGQPEVALCESEVIVEWLDEQWPQPPLLPAAPLARAQTRLIARFHDLYAEPALRKLYPLVASPEPAACEAAAAAFLAQLRTLQDSLLAPGCALAAGDSLALADCGWPALLLYAELLWPALGLGDLDYAAAGLGRVAAWRQALWQHAAVAPVLAELAPAAQAWLDSKLALRVESVQSEAAE